MYHHRQYPHAPNQRFRSRYFLFAPTAEAKKAGKASRRAEKTPKPPLAAGRTACKNWLSSIFTSVTLHNEFHRNLSQRSKKLFCKKQGLVHKKMEFLQAKAIFEEI